MAQDTFLVGGWLFKGERKDGATLRIQFSETELYPVSTISSTTSTSRPSIRFRSATASASPWAI